MVERYMYSPYGEPTVLHGVRDSSGTDTSADEWSARTSNTFENEIRYCGYRFDSETGLYHVWRRYYHATLGRWISRDPMGYRDGMGLYEYGASTPVIHTDPSGATISGPWDLMGPDMPMGPHMAYLLVFRKKLVDHYVKVHRYERDPGICDERHFADLRTRVRVVNKREVPSKREKRPTRFTKGWRVMETITPADIVTEDVICSCHGWNLRYEPNGQARCEAKCCEWEVLRSQTEKGQIIAREIWRWETWLEEVVVDYTSREWLNRHRQREVF